VWRRPSYGKIDSRIRSASRWWAFAVAGCQGKGQAERPPRLISESPSGVGDRIFRACDIGLDTVTFDHSSSYCSSLHGRIEFRPDAIVITSWPNKIERFKAEVVSYSPDLDPHPDDMVLVPTNRKLKRDKIYFYYGNHSTKPVIFRDRVYWPVNGGAECQGSGIPPSASPK
jgi:hypothetical protein